MNFLQFLPIINQKWGCTIKKLLLFFLFAITATFAANTVYTQENIEYETKVVFHGFPWGTSLAEFTAKMGDPAHTDEIDGLQSLVYDGLIVSGYPAFMLAYFSQNGLEGGTYYFHTFSLDELMRCYTEVQNELLKLYGPTRLRDGIIREMRPYETSWNLAGGYVYLKVNTRQNEPVTLWYSSPALTRKLFGS